MFKVKGNVSNKLWKITFLGYIFVLLYLTIFKRLLEGSVTGMFLENYQLDSKLYLKYNLNLIPFKTVMRYLTQPPSMNIALTNIVGNILAFMPLGILAPNIFRRLQKGLKVGLLCFSVSFIIEISQLIFRVGSADIDDIILNTIGGLIGYLFYRYVKCNISRYKSIINEKVGSNG